VNLNNVHLYAGGVMVLSENQSVESHVGAVYLQDYKASEFWDRLQGLSMRFADGQIINSDQIKNLASTGTRLTDYIIGDAADNEFHGMEGEDTIYGLAGDDHIHGGTGNDYLIGGAGRDTFYFGLSQGNDTIDERSDDGWRGEADTIQFDNSVTQNGLVVTHRSNDLLIGFQNSTDTLTLAGFLSNDITNERDMKLQFASGVSLGMGYIEKEIFRRDSGLMQYGTGNAANNAINGSAAGNYIYGDAGNDVIDGKSGNDWIDGGSGNDVLTGGNGIDTFRFGAGSGHDVIKDSAAMAAADRVRLDFTTGINNLTVEVLSATGQLKIGRHNETGLVTDSVQMSNALGYLSDIEGNEIAIGQTDLLDLVNKHLANRVITLQRNTEEDRYLAISAKDILGNALDDSEKSHWQIVSAEKQSGQFGIDNLDFDGDKNLTEESFFFAENFWGSGVNYVGFLPSENEGNASFKFTLQRDDGLTIISNMIVNVQSDTLVGTVGSDIIDGGQSSSDLTIYAQEGDDLVRDGYGNDVLHGGVGKDTLTHNWAGNGNDIYYGDEGDDTLNPGWGRDVMVGGSGNDIYIENNLWSGDHSVIDNTTAAIGDIDTLQLGEGYGMWDYRSLWFKADGNDLLINQIDAMEYGEIRIKEWFNESNNEAKLDVIRVMQDDGSVYQAQVNASFDALVQAMAMFSPPASVAEINLSLTDEFQAAWTLAAPAAA
jgi:Ca2+-binding RTX toxin-like protein